ncbi:Solute carrier family 15 member 4-like [Oopsacas minuta]|uniref:Solute carrier family 15 member 4-like n=1 Tax=Oopsacas minuta TaxID=111878 RepID=A0AAV7JXH7_9METZ|nr:Solute carrier family 15 member 4-like [Oopsacas minuta]
MDLTINHETTSKRERSAKEEVCFALKYQRGVIVLHAVNFLVKLAFYSIFTNITIISRAYFNLVNFDEFSSILSSIIFGFFLSLGYLLAPVTGFLTDTYFGRYKVLVRCSWMMFLSTIGYSLLAGLSVYSQCISDDLLSLRSDYEEESYACDDGELVITNAYLFLLLICMLVFNIFYSGYHANLCLYGAELLEDANESKKHNYFHIYHFIGVLAATIAGLLVVPFEYQIFPGSVLVYVMVPPVSLAIILILLRVFKKDFDENTVRLNPIVQISRTTWFAIKQARKEKILFTLKTVKFPTSVLDYGKVALGGKYTVEWIQEVKTFYRLIAIFLSFMWFFALRATTYSIFIKMGLHMKWPGNTKHKIDRILIVTFLFQLGNIVALPLIAILNAVIYKRFRRYYPRMLTGMGIGYFCGLLTIFLAIFIEIARSELANCDHNYILSIYYSSEVSVFAILPLYILMGLADSFAYATIREFTYAQSPSSMRGLIFGSLQGTRGFGTIISIIIIILAQTNSTCRCNNSDYAECSDIITQNLAAQCWYYTNCPGKSSAYLLYIVFTLLSLMFISLYILVAVNYRKRLTNFRIDEELKDSSAYHYAYKIFTKD